MFAWAGIAVLTIAVTAALFFLRVFAARPDAEFLRDTFRRSILVVGWLLALIAGGVAGQAFGLAADGEGAQWVVIGVGAALCGYALGSVLLRARPTADH